MEKKKIGRPTSDPKTFRFELRLSDRENAMIEECAQKLNCSKSSAILQGIRELYARINK